MKDEHVISTMFILRIAFFAILPLLFTNRSSSSVIKLSREKRFLSLIYPGTKWCGMGNEAKSYEDLGVKIKADKCCRTHDNCKDYIPAYTSTTGLHNDLPYTVSHCACDSDFQRCLKEANTETARKIGDIFFNVLKVPCFVWQKEDCHDKGCQEQRKAVLKLPKQFR